MFGISRAEAEQLINNKVAELKRSIEWSIFGKELPNPTETTRKALEEILSRIDPKDFLNKLLEAQGLDLSALIKEAVKELAKKRLDEELPEIINKVSDQLGEIIDTDQVSDRVAGKLTQGENKEFLQDLAEQASEKLADTAWENMDIEDLYPQIGEKVIQLILQRNQ